MVFLLSPLTLWGCSGAYYYSALPGISSSGALVELQGNLAKTTQLAEKGDPNAQVALGNIYWQAKYFSEGFSWYLRAAKANNALAQFKVGRAYATGQGAPLDANLALEWYKKSAVQGNKQAENAAKLLDDSVKTNSDTQASQTAQTTFPLPAPKLEGDGDQPSVHENDNKRAAIQPQPTESVPTSKVVKKKSVPNKNGKPRSAIDELVKKAEKGDLQAQLSLSTLYFEGKQVKKNPELAVKWGEKAAEQGDPTAQNNLGAAYTHGDGVEKNPEKARYWYEQAAKQGHLIARYNLAAAYATGQDRDYAKAYAWFTVVSNSKNTAAANEEATQELFTKSDSVLLKLTDILKENGQLEQAQALSKEYAEQSSH